ncbi:hypothetical protein SPRG_10508 [Saprolegnia parasitica CBS 223.65]|uniref:PABS domain-containing protein n=1 Tax=Saprolegnia parasitica (strain CBS 223.65) TaxID=695850 RepID=A0A067C3P5_SAPPC|nr:hypothetical protein SPRG_10508 [Saprolegnia parasitica CBS 223.65]KDO23730.1 hypothetical protein SPRG_10508 [Saprolegnia parasitica CBS 223.65]|eukprot:XP_012205548.1 hypothetical protein SPRG_10508 [Saprolegnia parasitica CBS 223.65]
MLRLALLAGAALAANPSASTFDILETRLEGETRVSTIRADMDFASSTVEMQFLLSDHSIMGAMFMEDGIREQAVYPGFAVMQSSIFLERQLDRALQIGLGVGTVPTFLRTNGVPTDAVELSAATVEMAASYFEYDDCRVAPCPRGQTYVMDGLQFLADEPTSTYDLVIIDVYTGFNVLPFYTQETLTRIDTQWLTRHGVVVMNFVGYYNEPNMDIVHAIRATFKSVFRHVRVFREMAANDLHEPANLIFYASQAPITFKFPPGLETPPPGYYEALVTFQEWEMLKEDEVQVDADGSVAARSAAPILTTTTDLTQFEATHVATVAFMEARCKALLPDAMWSALDAMDA